MAETIISAFLRYKYNKVREFGVVKRLGSVCDSHRFFFVLFCSYLFGEQGTLASHHCGPGSIPGAHVICGLSLLLVLVLVPRVFLRVPRFLSHHKNHHSQIPIRPGTVDERATLWKPLIFPFILFVFILCFVLTFLFSLLYIICEF